jgi:hypothetical protein
MANAKANARLNIESPRAEVEAALRTPLRLLSWQKGWDF